MGHRSWVEIIQKVRVGQGLRALMLVCVALAWSSAAVAAQKGPADGEPKRSYGSIDVIMYQTSW